MSDIIRRKAVTADLDGCGPERLWGSWAAGRLRGVRVHFVASPRGSAFTCCSLWVKVAASTRNRSGPTAPNRPVTLEPQVVHFQKSVIAKLTATHWAMVFIYLFILHAGNLKLL